MKRITDKGFVYHDSVESGKPGYLKRKFDHIKRQQRDQAKARTEALDNVLPITAKPKETTK